MKNTSKTFKAATTLATLTAVALLAGCTSTTMAPRLDSRFGQSVQNIMAKQTLNPTAGRSTDPVAGIDGVTGREIVDAYRGSFSGGSQGASGQSTTAVGSGSSVR